VLFNVGGIYKNEIKAADTMKRYENIPGEKQREALEYLFTLQSDLEWLNNKDVLGKLPVVGSPEHTIRTAIQEMILLAPAFARSTDGVITHEFSATECFDFIFDRVFKPTRQGKALTKAQRSFQKMFVESYMKMGNFSLPGSKKSFAISEDMVSLTGQYLGSSQEQCLVGELMYGPISGFEWYPRTIFNLGDLTVADLYAVLKRTRELLVSRRASANAMDKAHYDLLISTIDYSVK
jgi:hypothetical protein